MSREFYDTSMEIVNKVLSEKIYDDLLIKMKDVFEKTHISITEIDKDKRILYGYYFEKTLITPIEELGGKTILDVLFEKEKINDETYEFLKNKKLSVYKVKKVKKDTFFIFDMFDKKLGCECLTGEWIGLNKGDLIQGFLYFKDEPYLSPNGIIHPKGVDKYILKHVKEIIKNKNYDYIDEFLAKLFRKFVNSKRYFKKDAKEIYELDI